MRIWYLQMGVTHSSSRIIQDVYLALKSLEIVYRANGAAVEGLTDRNGHRRKEVGEGESVSWGGAQTKGEVREFKLAKICSSTVICCSCVRRKTEDH